MAEPDSGNHQEHAPPRRARSVGSLSLEWRSPPSRYLADCACRGLELAQGRRLHCRRECGQLVRGCVYPCTSDRGAHRTRLIGRPAGNGKPGRR